MDRQREDDPAGSGTEGGDRTGSGTEGGDPTGSGTEGGTVSDIYSTVKAEDAFQTSTHEKRQGSEEDNPETLRFGIDSILRENKHNVRPKRADSKTNDNRISQRTTSPECAKVCVSERTEERTEEVSDEEMGESEENDSRLSQLQLAMLRTPSSYSAFLGHFSESASLRPSASSFFHPSLPVGSTPLPWPALQDIRKDRFGVVRRVGHPYQNRTPPKRKKPRTSFTRMQIMELEKRFERQKYLASTERSTLAKSLKMTDAQVKTWFQNRRTKWRRQTAEEREMERQAANRLLLSLQESGGHPKSMLLTPDRVCLSQLQRWQENRQADT